MPIYVADCEGDGLRPTKFHVFSYGPVDGSWVKSIHDHDDIAEFLLQDNLTLVMHNGTLWDIPQLERVLGIKIKARLIDTLMLSWYLFPTRLKHGLEAWGEDVGVEKPEIKDWHTLTREEYTHRCETDVKINIKVLKREIKYLSMLYECSEEDSYDLPILKYLEFKLDCAKEQQRSQWRLDKQLCNETLEILYAARDEKIEALRAAMPKVPKYATRKPPAAPFKKDGTLSATGVKWRSLMRSMGLPEDHKEPVKEIVGYEEPNPKSHPQLKDWLFSLGWEPATFKYEKEDDGTQRAIPQIQTEDDDKNKMICPSVMLLAEDEPAIEYLDGLFVINHRISILEGFLSNEEDGFVVAEIQGLTNTMRFKHKTIVNLPGVMKPWGKEIRGCLIARDGYELCGSDMTSLEDMTKRHYIYDWDPEYVKEMARPGFDPHLDLAKHAKRITQEELDLYVENKKRKDLTDNLAQLIDYITRIRKPFKVVNYSSTYGVGAPKLSRTMGVPEKEAKTLLDAFWKRNWAIRKVAETQKVKKIKDQMWLFNPVSKFWYSLRYEKDIFSTLNQGTGVYCFDSWIGEVRRKRKQMTGQFHDEGIWEIKKGHREEMKALLLDAIERVNQRLKLNIQLSVDVQFGDSYADIH